MKITAFVLLAVPVVVVAALAAAIAFGGPAPPAQMASINTPFKSVDFSDLPPLQTYKAEDGASLSYRHYTADGASGNGSITLVHGSSGSSNSMHALARAFAKAGFDTFALDIRGHGASGPKGQIGYIGQMEDDMESFGAAVKPPHPATLAGFSSGGGFVLRFAGSARQTLFDDYLFMSPFLTQNAPNYRPGAGGWVNVGIPRIVALTLLNKIGITAFNDLAVTSFALDAEARKSLTSEYSFALAGNFQPHNDYQADIQAMTQPCAVLGGTADEVFFTDKLEGIFNPKCPVTLVPGVGHIPLTLEPAAVAAAVKAVIDMRSR